MEMMGATVVTDDMANMYATIPGERELARQSVAGSHLRFGKAGRKL